MSADPLFLFTLWLLRQQLGILFACVREGFLQKNIGGEKNPSSLNFYNFKLQILNPETLGA